MTVRIIIGGSLALALSALSIACCYTFGTHLASGNEGRLYGVLGGVADALKAVLPIGITAAFVSKQRVRAITGMTLFAVFSAYSFASELGLYALSRDAQSSTVSAGKEGFELIKGERRRIAERLKALGETRPSGTIKADIAAQHQNKLWTASSECAEASTNASRTFCAGLEKLAGELAGAEEAEKLRADDNKLAAKLSGMDLAAVLKSADPQSETLARFTGLSASTMRDALAILVALLIELGSGFGLWAVTASSGTAAKRSRQPHEVRAKQTAKEDLSRDVNQRREAKSKKHADPVKSFLAACTSKKPESEATAAHLYSAYEAWAKKHGTNPFSSTAFGRQLTNLGCERVKRGGVVRYVGLELRAASESDVSRLKPGRVSASSNEVNSAPSARRSGLSNAVDRAEGGVSGVSAVRSEVTQRAHVFLDRNRTPGSSPFVKITPASSKARLSAANVARRGIAISVSKRVMLPTET